MGVHIMVVDMLVDFLRNDIGKYNDYLLQLSEIQLFSPSTVRNYSEHLVKFIEWFVLIRKKKKRNGNVKQVRSGK